MMSMRLSWVVLRQGYRRFFNQSVISSFFAVIRANMAGAVMPIFIAKKALIVHEEEYK